MHSSLTMSRLEDVQLIRHFDADANILLYHTAMTVQVEMLVFEVLDQQNFGHVVGSLDIRQA
jgi:hypothetical protein